MTSPSISVIIPTFNVQAYIEETISSVLSQTFTDFEVIVIDDASTDHTVNTIRRLAMTDSRIRLVSNQRRKGVSGARNTGIDTAKGQWICFLDGDDLLHESALIERIKAWHHHPECPFFSGDYMKFSAEESKQQPRQSEENVDWRKVLRSNVADSNATFVLAKPVTHFMKSVLTWTGCVMVSTETLKRLKGFNETLLTAEDDHLWLRVAASSPQMVFVPTSLTFYRQRPGSLTQSGKAIHEHAVAAYRDLLNDPLLAMHSHALLDNIKSFTHQNTYHYRKAGARKKALYWAMQGLRYDTTNVTSWKNLAAALMLR